MPTKHIDAAQWDEIEQLTVELTSLTNQVVKESEVLKLIIRKGLNNITVADIAMQLEYKTRFNAMLIAFSETSSRNMHLEKPTVEETLTHLNFFCQKEPFLMCVYGKSNTGKSTYVEKLVNALNPVNPISVYDEPRIPPYDQIESAWRDYAAGKSVMIVLDADDQMEAYNRMFPANKRLISN